MLKLHFDAVDPQNGVPVPPVSDVYTSKEVFGKAAMRWPFCCLDAILVDPDDNILLGIRKGEPLDGGLWYKGGRAQALARPEDSLTALMKIDTGLEIAPERFRRLPWVSLIWPMPVDEKAPNGLIHDYSHPHWVRISNEEKARVQYDARGFESLDWMPIKEVIGGDYEPSLITVVSFLEWELKLDKLEENEDIKELLRRRFKELMAE